MGPIGRRHGGHVVGDTGAVLADANAVTPGDPRIAVGHVAGALLVGHGDELDAGGLENVEGVHIGRTDNAKNIFNVVGDQGFDESLARCHTGHGAIQIVPRRFGGCINS